MAGLLLLLSCSVFAQSSPLPSVDLRYDALSGPLSRPHVEGVHVTYGGELTLDSDRADADLPLKRYTLQGHAAAHEADTTIRAEEITFDGRTQHASAEDALVTRKVFTLHSARLNGTPDLLTFTDGDLTTVPPGQEADYHVRVQSITLDALHHRGILRNAAFYLFGAHLFTIPRVRFHVGGGGSAAQHQVMLPIFGVSARYGTYVTFGSTLSHVRYRLLLPTRQTIQAVLNSGQTLYAPHAPIPPYEVQAPGPVTLLDRIRSLATAPRGPLPEGDPLLFHDFLPDPNPIQLFDTPSRGGLGLAEEISLHLSASGRKRDDLYVTRLPEITLAGQLPVTPIPGTPVYGDPAAFRSSLRHIVLYASAQQTFGNYREQLSDAPYSIRARRVRSQIGLSARPLLVGQNTVLLPSILVSSSSYSGRKTAYRYDQLSLAVNHYFSDLTAVGVQFLASNTGGDSPFNFDVLDTSRELDLRLQVGNRRLVAAGRVRYDLSHSGVIDYQVAVAPALHGFSPVFSYNFRTRSIGLGLEVKGITF